MGDKEAYCFVSFLPAILPLLTRPPLHSAAAPTMAWYLAYFLHRYIHFRRPEFEAAARLAGLAPEDVEWRHPSKGVGGGGGR